MRQQQWCDHLVGNLSDDVRRDVAEDPGFSLEAHFGLTVAESQSFGERGDGGWCDGASFSQAGLVMYRPTGSRRQNFTLAHELAHHLIDQDEDCLSWLADEEEPGRAVEQLCDLIAGELLMARDLVDDLLAGSTLDAEAVASLFEGSTASRSACMVTMSRRLPCEGFIALIDPSTHEVFFATRAHDARPYAWKGDVAPAGHHLARDTPPVKARSWWPAKNGDRRQYYLSTHASGNWLFAVFAVNDLWGVDKLHVPTTEFEDQGYEGQITCPCGYTGPTRWWPCNTCGESQCPKCRECECDRRARRETLARCANCTVSVRAHLLDENDLCPTCQ